MFDDYVHEIAVTENDEFKKLQDAGDWVSAGSSFWDDDPSRLPAIRQKHELPPDDPRLASIRAFRDEYRRIEQSNPFGDKQTFLLNCCHSRFFPGLRRHDARTATTIPKIWRLIQFYLFMRARDSRADRDLEEVYGLLHGFGLSWARTPPYPDFTPAEARDELQIIANRLAAEEAQGNRPAMPQAAREGPVPNNSAQNLQPVRHILTLDATVPIESVPLVAPVPWASETSAQRVHREAMQKMMMREFPTLFWDSTSSPPAPAQSVDDSAFRPAKEMLKEPFDTYKAINKALKDNPWIRTRKPTPRRKEIHAGDWSRFLSQQEVDPLDAPAELVDAVVNSQKAKAEIDQKKGRK